MLTICTYYTLEMCYVLIWYWAIILSEIFFGSDCWNVQVKCEQTVHISLVQTVHISLVRSNDLNSLTVCCTVALTKLPNSFEVQGPDVH